MRPLPAAFLTRLRLEEHVVDGYSLPREWVLLGPLVYRAADGTVYIVPKGFVTDLASIPRPLRGLIETNDASRAPAVLHDYLYCLQLETRQRADALFREALQVRHVPPFRRNLMWSAVRTAGWIYWNKRANGQGLHLDDFVGPGYFNEPAEL